MHCKSIRHCGDKHHTKTNYGEIKLGLSVTKLLGGTFQSDIFYIIYYKEGKFILLSSSSIDSYSTVSIVSIDGLEIRQRRVNL